jgi:hypothetical protein
MAPTTQAAAVAVVMRMVLLAATAVPALSLFEFAPRNHQLTERK